MGRAESTADGDPTAGEFERIVEICDRFEAEWRRGRRPRIEEVLARNPSLSRPALLGELLALELELARSGGNAPTAGDYRARFPGCAEVIEAAFAEMAASGPTESKPSCRLAWLPRHFDEGWSSAPAMPTPAAGPSRIGRYTVLSLLDEGGQGRVFRVVHPGLGKDFVLKLAARPVVDDRSGRGLLAAEGRLLADLDHATLVRVIDLDVDEDGRPFLVMEYVAGCTLERSIEQGRPAPRRAAALVAEVARAVGYVHRRGVVHQDIKPRNVLIDEAGRPRLIDFGMARLRHAWAGEASGPSGGTLMFMAPEQARGEVERVGPAADIYALGGLLYFLLTGRAPVGGGSRSEAYERARRGAVDIATLRASAAPRRLQRLCLKALAPEPADRYSTADELAERLERAARGRGPVLAVAAGVLLVLTLLPAFLSPYGSRRAATPGAPIGSGRPNAGAGPGPLAVSATPGAPIESDRPLVHVLGVDGRPHDLREALPLRNGDQLWVSCKIPHTAHASIFWLDPEGVLTELIPEIVAEEATDTLVYPPSAPKAVVKLQGRPGTEFILVCARPDKPVTREELEAPLGAGRPLPRLPDRVILRLGSDMVAPLGPPALRSISNPVESDLSAALGPLQRIQRTLRGRTSFFAGVAFPHVGEQPLGGFGPPPANPAHVPR